jgi:hypothetical protein
MRAFKKLMEWDWLAELIANAVIVLAASATLGAIFGWTLRHL